MTWSVFEWKTPKGEERDGRRKGGRREQQGLRETG